MVKAWDRRPLHVHNQCVGDGLQTWHGGENKSLK
jgi:hypothetical protein